MLHAKFRGNRSTGYGEEDFCLLLFLLIYSAITACMTNFFAFRKMLINREMKYGQNETFCDFSLYLYYKLSSYRSTKCAD